MNLKTASISSVKIENEDEEDAGASGHSSKTIGA